MGAPNQGFSEELVPGIHKSVQASGYRTMHNCHFVVRAWWRAGRRKEQPQCTTENVVKGGTWKLVCIRGNEGNSAIYKDYVLLQSKVQCAVEEGLIKTSWFSETKSVYDRVRLLTLDVSVQNTDVQQITVDMTQRITLPG